MNAADAERDFRERIKHYEMSYQTLDEQGERETSFVKMVNVGKQVSLHFGSAAIINCYNAILNFRSLSIESMGIYNPELLST